MGVSRANSPANDDKHLLDEIECADRIAAYDAFLLHHRLSTRPVEEFVELLSSVGITFVADVRTVPRSRTNP